MRTRCSVAAVVVLLAASVAQAQPSDSAAGAEKLFDEGRSLVLQGRYAEACPKLAESHRLDPGVGTLLNLGDCYDKLGKTASAWATYREAATLADRLGQRERASFSTQRAQALEHRLAFLTIDVKQRAKGLVVRRDGQVVAEAVWSTAFPVDPGTHEIEASAQGYRAYHGSVTVAEQATVKTLVPVLAAEAPTPSQPPESRTSTLRTLGYAAAGVGAGVMAAGLVFGGLAKSKGDEAHQDHCSDGYCDDRGVQLLHDATRDATASTALVIAGGAVLAAGVVLALVSPKSVAPRAVLGGRRFAGAGTGTGLGGSF